MNLKSLWSLFVVMMITIGANAHTMWLEVKGEGKVGVAQEVRVFFGDFSWEKPTATAKWFSDISNFKLSVMAPDGTVTELMDRGIDSFYYVASFTPKQEGVYKVFFNHEVKDVYKGKKLTYASAGFVQVGKKSSNVDLEDGKFILSWKNAKNKLQMVYKEDGKPVANTTLSLVKQGDKDGEHSLKTDENGNVVFPKDWKGQYLLELTDSKKVPETDHNGKPFEFDYKEFSYRISL